MANYVLKPFASLQKVYISHSTALSYKSRILPGKQKMRVRVRPGAIVLIAVEDPPDSM